MIKSFLATLFSLFFLYTSYSQIGVFQDFVVQAGVEQAATIPIGNLTHYWKLNRTLTEEIGALNMTATGETYNDGKYNGAFQYERNVSYTQVADDASLSFVGATSGSAPDDPFSISLWVWFDSVADANALLSKRAGGGHEWQFQWLVSGNLGLVLYSGGAQTNYDLAEASWSPSIDTWYYVTATYSGNNGGDEVTIYIDGVDQGTLSRTGDVGTYVAMSNTTAPVYFGLYGPIPDNTFSQDGRMQNIALWDKELSQQEVTAIYNLENANFYLNGRTTSGNDLMSPRAGALYSNTSTDITDWTTVASAVITAATDITHSGTTSIKIVGSTSAAGDGSLVFDPAVVGTPAAIGETATFSGWAYITSAGTLDIEARIYHQSLGASAIAVIDASKLNEWQYFTISKERVDGTAFSLTLKADDGTVYFDDLTVEIN